MKFLFFPQSCLPIHAQTLEERPIGGIETGVIRLSECLAAMGHQVVVITDDPNPPLSEPLYLPVSAYRDVAHIDVLVAVRQWYPLLLDIPAGRKLYWTGDSYDQFHNVGMGDGRVIEKIDAFLAVSNWHADQLCAAAGFPRERAWVIRNGVKLSLFAGSEQRRPKRMMYSSTPFRGLKLLPLIFSELRRRHPDAELHVYSSFDVYAGAEPPPPSIVEEFERSKTQLATLPGCFLHGNLKQHELAREFLRSGVLLYPNTFEETSCITALEAHAAGCAIVTSALGALPETIGDAGILIPGVPGSAEYLRQFIESADRLLRDDGLRAALAQRGIERARDYDWSNVAQRLLGFLQQT